MLDRGHCFAGHLDRLRRGITVLLGVPVALWSAASGPLTMWLRLTTGARHHRALRFDLAPASQCPLHIRELELKKRPIALAQMDVSAIALIGRPKRLY